MPTYKVKMMVYSWQTPEEVMVNGPAVRELTVCFAGCADEDEAKAKARQIYHVAKFKKIEPA